MSTPCGICCFISIVQCPGADAITVGSLYTEIQHIVCDSASPTEIESTRISSTPTVCGEGAGPRHRRRYRRYLPPPPLRYFPPFSGRSPPRRLPSVVDIYQFIGPQHKGRPPPPLICTVTVVSKTMHEVLSRQMMCRTLLPPHLSVVLRHVIKFAGFFLALNRFPRHLLYLLCRVPGKKKKKIRNRRKNTDQGEKTSLRCWDRWKK